MSSDLSWCLLFVSVVLPDTPPDRSPTGSQCPCPFQGRYGTRTPGAADRHHPEPEDPRPGHHGCSQVPPSASFRAWGHSFTSGTLMTKSDSLLKRSAGWIFSWSSPSGISQISFRQASGLHRDGGNHGRVCLKVQQMNIRNSVTVSCRYLRLVETTY